jgi:putative SOS response-associated peptidase YedK
MKNDEPFAIGGVWDRWKFGDEVRHTFTIVTTDPNPMLAYIHNEPKASATPRMPFVVSPAHEKTWISPDLAEDDILPLITPYPEDRMTSHTVDRLRGKAYPGNVPAIMEPREYPDLQSEQGSLF